MKNNKGFTLIELIIVVTIIGILAMIAIPGYVGQQRNAARTEAFKNLEAIRLFEEQILSETAGYIPTGGGGPVSYNATPGVADNGIEDLLTGFQPGGCTACAAPFGLSFSYQVVSTDTNGDGLADTFTATATGVAGSRVAGEVYTINQNNIKNF